MSNRIIEKLLNGAEVEWKPLGKVAELKRGKTITAKDKTEGNIPVISGGQKPAYYTGEYNREGETITVAGSGAYAGFLMYWNEPIFLGDAFSVKPNLDILITKYVYHFLLSKQQWIFNLKKGSGVPHVYPKDLAILEIPIPPLEIQQKIVKTLDKFTELEATLEATLEAELALRVKQYNYYRDLLLNENQKNPFFKNIEYRCLGDITLSSSNVKWKNNTNIYKYIDLTSVDRENHSIGETIEISALTAPSRAQKLVAKDDVIFATTRPTQLRFTFINEEFENSIASTGYCVLRANTNLVLPKWIYHNLGSIDFKNFLEENQSGSAYPAVSDSKVKEYKIPIPPLEIQEKIILILDKFENLANSIKDGLPREVELRKKQYEYYRNELLNFSNQRR